MKVECYRSDTADKGILGVDDGREKICQELGLSRQAKILSGNAGSFYPAMTREQLFIWGQFLPVFHSKNDGNWENYDFDVIPKESLEEISFAVSLGVFTDLEIWRPKGIATDPLVVGLVGARINPNANYHMIVRWGESLRDFIEIKREILLRFQENKKRKKVPEIAQTYMNNYIVANEDNSWGANISFIGVAFRKSTCCRKDVYKFGTHYGYDKHLVCSRCGNAKIKRSFSCLFP